MLDLPNTKKQLDIYIRNYIEMLEKEKYPVGKRFYVQWCLEKAREKFKKIKK